MKSFIISATIGLFAALSQAVAIPTEVEARQYFQAQLIFHGATPDAFYTVSVPTGPNDVTITNNPLSITSITLEGGASCAAYGVDGSRTVIVGAETVPVGPPQTQLYVSCQAL